MFKDPKQWNSWNRDTTAQARAHDVLDVFNPNYIPPDRDAAALFQQKQAFVYAVFNRTVQTDSGKAFVREHEADFDAQRIYEKLILFASDSYGIFSNA